MTIITTIEIDTSFASDGQGDDFEAFLDRIIEEFDAIGIDVDCSASLRDLTATWAFDIADASDDSTIEALSNLRTALHAAGCGTSNFPNPSITGTRNTRSDEFSPA